MFTRLLILVLVSMTLASCLDTKLDITADQITPPADTLDQYQPGDLSDHDTTASDLGADTSPADACSGESCDTAEQCTPQSCATTNPCQEAVCNAATGKCDLLNANDGQPCEGPAAKPCFDTLCQEGECLSKARICLDENPCTQDSCDSQQDVCLHENLTGNDCEDGDACTLGDQCLEGVCVPGALTKSCDDSNPCTDNQCDPATGECQFPNNTTFCEDGNPCTVNDTCLNGQCQSTTPNDCNDLNFCTKDTCSTTQGCQHELLSGAFCDDTNPCTIGEKCMEGFCGGGDLNVMAPGCVPVCQNGTCEPGEFKSESEYYCPHDCGYCGDAICSNSEHTNNSCPKDCDVVCGNKVCEGGEGLTVCLVDCGGCGDHFCGSGEVAGSPSPCPGDCPASCGNAICEVGESANSCEFDCKPTCGDLKCEMAEAASTCPKDCGVCGDGFCALPEEGTDCPLDCVRPCGDGLCEGGEDPDACAVDCGPCGDGVCGKSEDSDTCAADCSFSCGDGVCTVPENETNCFVDCGCVPDCMGKKCGPDGCGGQCGVCPAGIACNLAGTCACAPLCAGRICGDDGCGAFCGLCPGGTLCKGEGSTCCPVSCNDQPCSPFCAGPCGFCAAPSACQPNGTCQ